MHRLGIDVWKMRDARVSSPEAIERQPAVTPSTSVDVPNILGNPRESNESRVVNDVARVLSNSETIEPGSTENEKLVSDSSDVNDIADDPSFELQCLLVGTCLLVFDPNEHNSRTLAEGIGRAVCKYQETALKTVNFTWPPVRPVGPSKTRRHGGWESARRAFHSLVKSHDWTFKDLVSIGQEANQVTETNLVSGVVLLKLDEFPSDGNSKRKLWQRIREML